MAKGSFHEDRDALLTRFDGRKVTAQRTDDEGPQPERNARHGKTASDGKSGASVSDRQEIKRRRSTARESS